MFQIRCRKSFVMAGVAAVIGLSPIMATAQPAPSATVPAQASAARVIKVPEGQEMTIQFEEKLSSATAVSGDRFAISLADPMTLPDGTVIPAGYRGRGEVISAQKRGFVGKAGELNVRLEYIRVGDDRVKLRASKSAEGKGSLGSAVALTVLFGPLGLLARGANIEIPRGQTMTVYVDADSDLTLPMPSPPKEEL